MISELSVCTVISVTVQSSCMPGVLGFVCLVFFVGVLSIPLWFMSLVGLLLLQLKSKLLFVPKPSDFHLNCSAVIPVAVVKPVPFLPAVRMTDPVPACLYGLLQCWPDV